MFSTWIIEAKDIAGMVVCVSNKDDWNAAISKLGLNGYTFGYVSLFSKRVKVVLVMRLKLVAVEGFERGDGAIFGGDDIQFGCCREAFGP